MTKYIKSFTKEQKAAMPGWAKKYIDIGLCTERADWDRFERGARACYAFAGLNKDVSIIRVSSPLVGALASSIARSIIGKLKKRKRGPAVYSAVESAVRSEVESAVSSAVRSEVESAVWSAVSSAVYSAVSSAVRSEVESAVWSAVRSEVESAVWSAVESAVGSKVESAVRSAVRSEVEFAVNSAVSSKVESAVRSAVYSAVESAVSSAVYSAVESSLKKPLQWHYWFGGQMWPAWSAYYDFIVNVCGLEVSEEIRSKLEAYLDTVKSACYWWPNRDFIMVCDRPLSIHRNGRGQPHCENDMAIKWPDGWGLYMLNGIKVPEWLVKTDSGKIDPKLALTEKNVDVQREIIRKVGAERMLKACKAKTLDVFVDSHTKGGNEYKLMEMKVGQINRKYLYFEHASLPGVWYAQPVHPNVKKALHGRAMIVGVVEHSEEGLKDLEQHTDEEIKEMLPVSVS